MKNLILMSTSLTILALSACSNTEKPDSTTPPPVATSTETTTSSTTAIDPVTTSSSFSTETATAANSLCKTNEKVLFNCQMASADKTLSVCASDDLTNNSGYLQYRYGSDANTIDMRFPKDRSTSQSVFSYSTQGLSFNNGSIKYRVYTQGSAGIKTFWARDPSRNKTLPCRGTVTNQLSQLEGILN